ncbi:hypothetical protein H6802_00275 [Candidatus Nomurabacteria bacterium]|uniref:Alpha/beta hydrolase n=1 Tax=candidate division WWE3 bacterium TaxID=2053526 RepID=A0A955E030_UNCKA|nr:hypothetical protein [candidate division WWE3 bacterium]MCB9823388.1 hypothetical protein [Candidatus Nomurabacteria bacterium]MCB9826719.1 hypothetical protein [Candidatus Nomurabacteria bacterium]MCB9827670.1 hypothetical protein [Candidatus Nomurabacteria bacterium]HXK52549.1 hypothetical protein [bacterium]
MGNLDTFLRNMLNYAIVHSKEICGYDKPEIYLMGLSAGAGAISKLASWYSVDWRYQPINLLSRHALFLTLQTLN